MKSAGDRIFLIASTVHLYPMLGGICIPAKDGYYLLFSYLVVGAPTKIQRNTIRSYLVICLRRTIQFATLIV